MQICDTSHDQISKTNTDSESGGQVYQLSKKNFFLYLWTTCLPVLYCLSYKQKIISPGIILQIDKSEMSWSGIRFVLLFRVN